MGERQARSWKVLAGEQKQHIAELEAQLAVRDTTIAQLRNQLSTITEQQCELCASGLIATDALIAIARGTHESA